MSQKRLARACIAELPKGTYRLNWLGSLCPARNSETSFDIEAQFVSVGDTRAAVHVVKVPLGALPKLVLGTVWKDTYFDHWGAHEVARVEVIMPGLQGKPPSERIPFSILSSEAYSLHGLKRQSACYIFPTKDGPDLIVPSSEILRTWYLFHPRVIPAVLGGGTKYPQTISANLLPWSPDPEQTRLKGPDRFPQIARAKNISDDIAKRLARLIFVPLATVRSYHIYTQLRSKHQTSTSEPPQVHSLSLPSVLPPYEGLGAWTVWYKTIPATDDWPARRLVLRIVYADTPLPYTDIKVVRANDGTQAPNKNDPLPGAWSNGPQPINLPLDDGLELSGEGGDDSLEDADMEDFGFQDSAVFAVRTHLREKDRQFSKHSGKLQEAIGAMSVSVDPTGLAGVAQPSEGTGARGAEPVTSEIPTTASILSMKRVFQAVIDEINASESEFFGWKAQFLVEGGLCLRVVNAHTEEARQFLVLEITDGTRVIYILEAARGQHEDFKWAICSDVDERAISRPRMGDWLSGFPYAGTNKWIGGGWGCQRLKSKDHKHQPRLKKQTELDVFGHFVRRIQRKILDFLEK